MALLNEGITHLEDLDIKAFIDAVRRIGSMNATEKLDGANLWFGLDEKGELYTTREGKRGGSEKFYSEQDYPYFAAYNGFRGAHAALEKKQADIKTVLSPGDTIEIEVLYGRQPNAVTYGLDNKSFIAFLRGVEGTNDIKVDQLAAVLQNQEVSVKTIIVDTDNGVDLDRKAVTQTFRFVGVQKIDAGLLKSVNVEKQLKKLEAYLDNESGINNLSNFELMTTSLGSIPKEERAAAKAIKDEVLATVKTKFKVEIKKELLDKFVSKVKPQLAASDLSNDEDVGIEGVVLKDPTTGEQIKIVDKDNFTTINAFNFAVRNQIAGMVRTIDDAAPLESRGGITGQMKIRIADLLGNKELALGRSAKKIFADNKGETPTQTLKNVAKILNGAQDFNGTKKKIQSVVAATIDELQAMLDKFNKHRDDADNPYRLKLKNGKTIGLSPEIVKRTLMTFAETRRNLTELHQKVGEAKSFDGLIGTLYGRAAKAAHATEGDEGLEESFVHDGELLLEVRNFTDPARYKAVPDAWTYINIYVVTALMTAVIFQADDKQGSKIVKDKAHAAMKKWDANMSPLNFWGYPLWHASAPAVVKLFHTKKIAADLFRTTRKVPQGWSRYLHLDLSYGADKEIDWDAHQKTLKFLIQQTPGSSIDRLNSLLADGFKYETMSYDEKVKFLPKLYFYARQFVPTSPLISRVHAIQNDLLASGAADPLDATVAMAPGQKTTRLLGEDGEIAPGPSAGPAAPSAPPPSASSSTSNATTSGRIASVETGIGRKRMIVRRKRNPDAVALKFAKPKPEDQQ